MASPGTVSVLFTGILDNHVLYSAVFLYLSPYSRYQFGLVCHAALAALTGFYYRVFNINNHLQRFFTDPLAFRRLQAQTGTLISGSSALQFFDHTFYPESDLNLYTFPAQTRRVCSMLVEMEGYSLLPGPHSDALSIRLADADAPPWGAAFPRVDLAWSDMHATGYRSASVGAVYSFEKEQDVGPPLRLQVISARNCPLQCILGFHSTCVMNFIAFDAAYCLYPLATLEHRIALSFAGLTPKDIEAVAKYSVRGWRLISHHYPFRRCLKRRLFMLNDVRSPLDKRTWRVPLDMDNLSLNMVDHGPDALPNWDPTIHNSWMLESVLTADGEEMRMSYHVVKPSVFKYAYTHWNFEVVRKMLRFLKDQGTLEHAKVGAFADDASKWVAWRWWDASLPRLIYKSPVPDWLRVQSGESSGIACP